jgi:hypothetical protein
MVKYDVNQNNYDDDDHLIFVGMYHGQLIAL